MTADDSLFDRLAFPFLPAEPGRPGVIVEADPDWRLRLPTRADASEVVIWGRTPDSVARPDRALRAAIARERSLRTLRRQVPDRLGIRAVHRLPAARLGPGRRSAARAAVRAGAIVELGRDLHLERVLDACLRAAGVPSIGSPSAVISFGSGGTLLARVATPGGPGLLRLARIGSAGDPGRLQATLGWVAKAGVAMAPRPLGGGSAAGGSWTLETLLPGRRPTRFEAALAREVARTLATFPKTGGPPAALAEDLEAIAAALPASAARVRRVADEVAADVAGLPAILRHGDLWSGNLLVHERQLAGFVDWDAAHPAGVPGSDLVQLIATDLRARRRQALGPAFLARPWDSTEFRSAAAAYWPASGVDPTARTIELAGLGWWAAEVRGTLSRLPHRTTDERWLETNVDPVLSALGV